MRFGFRDGRGSPQAPLQPEPSNDFTLRFAEDGTFKITVFSDFHFAESEDGIGPVNDAKTAKVMRNVLEHEHSQLVVLNGDLISGYGTVADNATHYVDQIVAPMVDANLPWASTYGNHDNERFAKPGKIFEREKSYPNSLTQNMVPGGSEIGMTNYYLPVHSSSGSQHDAPEVLLWFFDSRGGAERRDWVHSSVVKWFEEKNANLTKQYNRAIPSLAFFHIPISSMFTFWTHPGVDSRREPGFNGEKVWWQGRGYDDKTGHDTAFMAALSKTDRLLATFSGHDHDNDWCFKWNGTTSEQPVAGNGIHVCYGRHTGYGGYGNLERGGRQILLKKDTLDKNEVLTWIRLESGRVPVNVTLNATYGQDEYNPVSRHVGVKRDSMESQGHTLAPEIYSVMLFLFMMIYLPLRLWH
ncbi:conserved hypothetical protein [Uncinocarpus reesii 1704]|uniref:Calcineurin-like phosphoesterase domain-containing protein n=1 Tax=Uncinocarpus reesii (strain UAMH 1704) TaxID=336963 RepID=C4JDK3_UNCRE|nr:uncharacterized protein UREG_00712 [Uncinocarpus reesii 1704]EEP75865.1 conserved hypothetical protein [Uncinocarpus reesii 1704]